MYLEDSATPSLAALNELYRKTGVPTQLPKPAELQTPCLVGADGARSVVRRSLCPGTPAEALPYAVYSGWRRLTRSVFDRVCAPAMPGGATMIETRRPGGVVLGVYVNDAHSSAVDVGFTYSRPARSGGEEDPLYVGDRLKEEGGLGGEHDSKYIPEQFWEEIAALGDGDGLEQPFKHMFDVELMKADGRVTSWLMRSALMRPGDLRRAAEHGSFFIGDAVHTEPILGGDGVHKAIMDGIGLGNCIATHGLSGIPDWYESRYAEWQKGVEDGKAAIRELHGGL